ncbi:phage terminase small subunit [Mycobacterium kansasii]
MAGRGPAPKPEGSRARRNGSAVSMKVYTSEPTTQPELPEFDVQVEVDGAIVSQAFIWPPATRRWWETWGAEPMAADFTATDWDFLLDTALLHARVWAEGDLKLLPELRLRVAKLGATGEDRARLRITYAAADQADEKRKTPPPGGGSRSRRGPLKAV